MLALLLTTQLAAQETGKVELERQLAIVDGPVNDPYQWVAAAYNVAKFYQSNPSQSERYYHKALKVAEKHDLLEFQASIYTQLHILYRTDPKGLPYLLKAMAVVEKLADQPRLMNLKLMLAGHYFHTQQHKKAISLYEELLPEFRKSASRMELVVALYNYGNAVLAMSDFEKAVELGEVVSSIASKIPNPNMEQRGMLLQGKALKRMGQNEASLRILNDALKKAEASLNVGLQATALIDMASLLIEIGDLSRARPYLVKAADLTKQNAQPEQQFFVRYLLARLYINLGELENAATMINQLQELQTGRKIGNNFSLQLLKGRLFFEQGEAGRGIDLLQRGLLYKGPTNVDAFQDRLIVATYFSEKAFYKKAEEHFTQLKADLKRLPAGMRESYDLAWKAHELRKKGKKKEEITETEKDESPKKTKKKTVTANQREHERVLQLEDSLRQTALSEQIALLDAENKRKAAEIRKNEFRFYVFLLSLLLLLVVSGFGLFWYRNRKRQAELLAEKERKIRELELEEAEKQKKLEVIDALLSGQEIERKRIAESLHDDVGSMLSALRLQLERFETEEQPASKKAHMSLRNAKSMLDHVATDVRNLSHLLMPTSLEKFGLKKAVELYVEQLNHAGKVHFELLITGFDQPLSEKLELSTYRILLELCNNILKHAEARNVIIQLVEHDDQLVVMVEDNGKGFEPVDNSSDGIGLRTIESRIHLMNGRMSVETSPGQGTLISIELPIAATINP